MQHNGAKSRGSMTVRFAIALIVMVVTAALGPSAAAQALDGNVEITAGPAQPGVAQVEFSIQNRGEKAEVRYDALALPAEVAGVAQCRAERGSTALAVDVAQNGTIMLPVTMATMPQASELRVTCRFEVGELCGLDATARASWLDQSVVVFERTASAPVTPPCSDDTFSGAFVHLTKHASLESAPVGSVVTWTLTAQNLGTRRLTTIDIADPLPAALEFVPGSADDAVVYDETTRTVHARIDRIPVGESATIRFATRVLALSLIPNEASVVTRQGAVAVAQGRVFGLAAEPSPTPERPRDRDRDRPPRRLAHTGDETPLIAIVGTTMIAAGAMVLATSRRRG